MSLNNALEALFSGGAAGFDFYNQEQQRLQELALRQEAQDNLEAWRSFERERSLADMVSSGQVRDASTPELTVGPDLFGGGDGLGMQPEIAPNQTYAAQRVAAESMEPALDRANAAIADAGDLFASTASVPGMTEVPDRDYRSEYDGPVFFEEMGGYRPSTPDEMARLEQDRLMAGSDAALQIALQEEEALGELRNRQAAEREREKLRLYLENPEAFNAVSGQGYLNRPERPAYNPRPEPTEDALYRDRLEQARKEAMMLRRGTEMSGPEFSAALMMIANLYQVDPSDFGLGVPADGGVSGPPAEPWDPWGNILNPVMDQPSTPATSGNSYYDEYMQEFGSGGS